MSGYNKLVVYINEMIMKILMMVPKNEFTVSQQKKLSTVGKVVYSETRDVMSIKKLINLGKKVEILGADPDNFGGFEKARKSGLIQLLKAMPKLKGVALSTSSFDWVNLDYCQKRKIIVTNVPNYSTQSVAEHTIAILICLSKKIIISDRRTQQGRYKPELGSELKGKTLGIIGLGNIGCQVSYLGKAIGMEVIGWNRTPKQIKGVKIRTLDEVLSASDYISLNLAYNSQTQNFISSKEIKKMKKGVIIVNLAMRKLVDEPSMARGLKQAKIISYGYEGEDLKLGPLSKIETAIGLKGFAWYTKEALNQAINIWVKSIISIIKQKAINQVA